MADQDNKIQDTNILVIFACPEGTDDLRLGREDRVIRECLDLSKYRDNFSLDVRHAATPYDLRRALLGGDYRIVHFSGHGTGHGLVLEDSTGQPQVVPQQALADLLGAYSPPIECVILNACRTDAQGEFVSLGVPYTIGMSGGISDAAAQEFTRGFYDAIGAGKDVEFAFQEGCRSVNLAGLGDDFEPVLFGETRDQEQAEIKIVSQQQVKFDEEEGGFLDYILDGIDSMESVKEILARMTSRTNDLGQAMEDNRVELERVSSAGDHASLRESRRIVNRSADALETFASHLAEDTPLFRNAYSTAIDYYGKAVTLLTTEFDADNSEQIEEALRVVKSLHESMISARSGASELRGSIAALPRMTRKLNQAKRLSLTAMDNFDREMEAGLQLTVEVQAVMERLVAEHGHT